MDENGGYTGSLSYQAVTGVTLPSHGAAILLRELPPSQHFLHLWLDKDNFSKADSLTLHWQLTPGANSSQNIADAYLAAMTPQRKLYFYDGRFSETIRPVARSMRVGNASGSLGPFPLAGLPSGEYTWHAVLVSPGTDPLASSNRISNLPVAAFSIF